MLDWLLSLPIFRGFLVPLMDIAVLSFLFYKGYQILVQTRAVQLIRGTVLLFILYGIAFVLNLRTLLTVLNLMVPGLVIAISIIFQPELRKIFTKIGQGRLLRYKGSNTDLALGKILTALERLAVMKRGALIVFERAIGLKNLWESGVKLDASISQELIMSIFAYDTDLHDGAIIIENGRIAVAKAVLPLTSRADLNNNFGTRHRAAIGVVEESDAIALVLSEETSSISIAYDGILYYNLDTAEIKEKLGQLLGLSGSNDDEKVTEVVDGQLEGKQ